MIGRAAILAGALAISAGTQAVAQGIFEVDRFEYSGWLPPGFDRGTASYNFDGYTFDANDDTNGGRAQFVVYGSNDEFDGVHSARTIVRETLLFNQSSITYDFSSGQSFVFSGYRADGKIYYFYSRAGKTCDGRAVFGSFVLAYHPDAAAIYNPMIEPLIDAIRIGKCG